MAEGKHTAPERFDFEAERRRAQQGERRLWLKAFDAITGEMSVAESAMKPPVFFLVLKGNSVAEAQDRQTAERIAACWNYARGHSTASLTSATAKAKGGAA